MKEEIRHQWQEISEEYKDQYAQVVDKPVQLNEDYGPFMTTEAEILVFGLDRSLLPMLQFSYLGYEAIVGIINEFDPELIAATRSEEVTRCALNTPNRRKPASTRFSITLQITTPTLAIAAIDTNSIELKVI